MLDDIIAERKKKLAKLREAGIDPYPARAKRTHTIGDIRAKFAALSRGKKRVAVAGRLMGLRDQGKLIFADLKDESGSIQLVLKKDNLPNFDLLKATLDMGDFVTAAGTPFTTQKGEESIEAKDVQMLAKSIRPLPGKWYGIEETEIRLRKRYLDLLLNEEMKSIFRKKAAFWASCREFMAKEGFLEVEMPVFEALPGGAEAEPFVTHHNALDTDFYLRISLELPLKKLLVGGFEKVFEMGRIFRNEGIDREHLQDYTQLEFYWAYVDYYELMAFIEKMYKHAIKMTMGTLVTVCGGTKIDWGKKWPTVDYVTVFKKESGIDPLKATRDELTKKARSLGIPLEPNLGKGRLIDLIYKKTVRPKLTQPCFLVDPPVDIEPLAKRKEGNSACVERVQVVACGMELGKGFSELNDPGDQRARFEEQMKLRAAGDTEAQQLDEDYLEAMEYGMPPAAGFGVSERLFAVLMDKPVRETVIFPLMRPKT